MPIQPPARQGSSVHKTLAALRDGECSKLDLIEAGAGNRRWLENLLSQLHVAGHVQKRTVYRLTETGLAMLDKIDAWRPRKRSESRKTRTKAAFLPGVELGDAPAFIAPDPDAVRSLAQALDGWRVGEALPVVDAPPELVRQSERWSVTDDLGALSPNMD